MNALLLPGNSARHGEWIENLKLALAPYFQHTETQHYRHWKADDERADIDYEISIALEKVGQLKPFIIIAKSIGTVISVKAVVDGKLKPEKLILLGVPNNGGVSKYLFKDWLGKISVPVVFVQNTNDPLGSFADVKATFNSSGKSVSFVELPGETHDYLDFNAIAKLI